MRTHNNVSCDLVEKAKTTLKDIDLQFLSVEDFVQQQIISLIELERQWKQQ